MKILIASSSIGTYGGIEAFVLALATSLQKNNLHQIKIVWKRASNLSNTEALIHFSDKSEVPYTFVSPRSLALWKEIKNADIVHAQNSPPDIVLMAKILRKPLVLTIHNRQMKEHFWKSKVWFFLQRLADQRWYNSEFVRQSWEGQNLSLQSRVIPTVSTLPEGTVEIKNRKGFCFASRWIPNKGIEVLLEAYQQGEFDPFEWPLQMIGDGPLFSSMRKKYETTLGVYFHGFIDESEKSKLIRHARWMIVPPHTQEDLGLTAIEARNVGVPCIVTRDGGLPEAAGDEALLCEPQSVDSLLTAMRKAITLSSEEYQLRSERTQSSLKTYLMPLSEYSSLYQKYQK